MITLFKPPYKPGSTANMCTFVKALNLRADHFILGWGRGRWDFVSR